MKGYPSVNELIDRRAAESQAEIKRMAQSARRTIGQLARRRVAKKTEG